MRCLPCRVGRAARTWDGWRRRASAPLLPLTTIGASSPTRTDLPALEVGHSDPPPLRTTGNESHCSAGSPHARCPEVSRRGATKSAPSPKSCPRSQRSAEPQTGIGARPAPFPGFIEAESPDAGRASSIEWKAGSRSSAVSAPRSRLWPSSRSSARSRAGSPRSMWGASKASGYSTPASAQRLQRGGCARSARAA